MARGKVGTAVREAKEAMVAHVAERLASAASTVLVDYRGLKVAEDVELRRRLGAVGVEYRVIKNTVMTRAAAEAGLTTLDTFCAGPTAVAFSLEDPVAGPRALSGFAREHASLQVKAGVLSGQVIDPAGVQALAELPSREVLLARVAGAFAAPLAATAGLFGAPLRAFATVTDQLAQSREGAPAA